MKKRILAVIMAVCVSMTALPADVRAAEDSAVQTDLNFFMIYYVFPAILLTEHDDAKLIADHLCSRWGEKFKNSKIQYTDYDSLYVSFREKIFGIF